jgi:hypothetical protein
MVVDLLLNEEELLRVCGGGTCFCIRKERCVLHVLYSFSFVLREREREVRSAMGEIH